MTLHCSTLRTDFRTGVIRAAKASFGVCNFMREWIEAYKNTSGGIRFDIVRMSLSVCFFLLLLDTPIVSANNSGKCIIETANRVEGSGNFCEKIVSPEGIKVFKNLRS